MIKKMLYRIKNFEDHLPCGWKKNLKIAAAEADDLVELQIDDIAMKIGYPTIPGEILVLTGGMALSVPACFLEKIR